MPRCSHIPARCVRRAPCTLSGPLGAPCAVLPSPHRGGAPSTPGLQSLWSCTASRTAHHRSPKTEEEQVGRPAAGGIRYRGSGSIGANNFSREVAKAQAAARDDDVRRRALAPRPRPQGGSFTLGRGTAPAAAGGLLLPL